MSDETASKEELDVRKSLWLSETSARDGAYKILSLEKGEIQIVIPPKSHNGLVIRLKGLGRKPSFDWNAPFLDRKRGNLLVKLFVYPDKITPKYGSFDMLPTDSMALEGWVYRRIDKVIYIMGEASFPANPLQTDVVADLFNERGWRGIFRALVNFTGLDHHRIEVTDSDSITLPGECQSTYTVKGDIVAKNYVITINKQFLDNPFSIAAIIAHELCHVIYSERIDDRPRSTLPAGHVPALGFRIEQDSPLDVERTVDLLVFMFKLGEFQLRVARDKRLTLGYFDQEIFERIQVIVSRKFNSR